MWTDCKLDQFVNGWLVFKLVIQFKIESWWMVYKQLKRHESCTTSWTARKLAPWPELHKSWLKDLQKHTSKAVLQVRPNQPKCNLFWHCVIGWPGLACKTNNIRLSKGTDQPHSQIVFRSFFSWAFIGTREGLLTPRCYVVSFPDCIFYACQKSRLGELPIPSSFKCAGMLAHCSFVI